jgi:hypothetical protein
MKTALQALGALAVAASLASIQLGAQARPQAQSGDTQTSNMPVPASIHQLKAHEVVEQIISQRHHLLLSDPQFEELTTLHRAVREERAIYESTGRSKPPYQRPVWITTPEQALAKAFTILTPQQQHQSLMLFAQQGAKKPD